MPMMSTDSPELTIPSSSILPVATVPRPVIENNISTLASRIFYQPALFKEIWISYQTASINSHLQCLPTFLRRSNARVLNLRLQDSYHIQIMRKRKKLSDLSSPQGSKKLKDRPNHIYFCFINTTNWGTPTWRSQKDVSHVCGIGPSVAATTRMLIHWRHQFYHVFNVISVSRASTCASGPLFGFEYSLRESIK